MQINFRNILNLIFLWFLMPFTLYGAELPSVHFSFQNDGRHWNLVYEEGVDQQKIYEYIPDNTTLDNWSDLVSVQYLQGDKEKPQAYYDRFMGALRKSLPSNKVESRIISKDGDKSLFWTWWIQQNTPLDQHEWIRIFVADNHTAFLRYTTKDSKNAERYGSIWQKIIGDATFTVPPNPTTTPAPAPATRTPDNPSNPYDVELKKPA